MTVKENPKEYACHYGHRFKGNQVKLLPFKNDSRELVGCVTFIKDEDGKWFKGGRPLEGYLMACPQCGIIQLGGFVCPGDAKLEPKIPDELRRNIQLSL